MKKTFVKLLIIPLILIITNETMTIEKNRYYYIKSVLSGDQDKGYWDLSGFGRSYIKDDPLHLWAFDKGDDRRYMITPAGNGWYYISPRNAASGRVFRGTVDVAGENIQNGSKLKISDNRETGNSSRQFKIKDIGEGKSKIYVNRSDGKKIVCAEGNTDKNGTAVIVLDDNENPSCQWRFIEAAEKL